MGNMDEISYFYYSWVALDVISTPSLLPFTHPGAAGNPIPLLSCAVGAYGGGSWLCPEEPNSACLGSGVQLFSFSCDETLAAARGTRAAEGSKPPLFVVFPLSEAD